MTPHHARALRGAHAVASAGRTKGFTALELLAAMAVAGIMLNFAVPRLSKSDFALYEAHQQLIADLRNTRADALISGDHFRLEVTGRNTYAEHRMTFEDDVWTPAETASRSRTLHDGLAFTSGVGASLEFNTRGLLVDSDAATTLRITDARTGVTHNVTIWPSGQVSP